MAGMNRRDWLQGVVTSVVGAQMVIAARNAEQVGSLVVPNQKVDVFAPQEGSTFPVELLASPLFYYVDPHIGRGGPVRLGDPNPKPAGVGKLVRFGYLMGQMPNGEWRVSRA